MKKIINYMAASAVALAFASCSSDIEQTVYDTDKAVPAGLSTPDAAYVLDAQKSDQTALTLNWTEPELGYEAAYSNAIEIDVAGKKFEGKITLAIQVKGIKQYSITHQELNNQMLALVDNYSLPQTDPVDVEMRIATTVSSISGVGPVLYSNVVKTTITPFVGERQYPSLAIRGGYNNWDFNVSQKLYSKDSDDKYAAMVFLDGGEWKICEDENWGTSWGLGSDTYTNEMASLVLSGGNNINIYKKKSYYLEFNKTTKELKVSKPHDTWGVVGDFNGWGNDIPLTLASEVDAVGNTQWILTATVTMDAGNGWKIRPDNTWTDNIGSDNITYEGDVTGGGNFFAPEAGEYTIKWYFNKVEPRLVVTKN